MVITLNKDLLASLKRFDEATFDAVLRAGIAVKVSDNNELEEFNINPDKLRIAFHQSFNEWQAKDAAVRAHEEAERQAAQAKLVREEADKRVYEYVAVGLLDDDYNKTLLRNYMINSGMSYSASAVSIAVNALSDSLHWAVWAPRNTAPVEPPQAAEEVLGRVKGTNEKQLPLNISEADLAKASPAQIKDWMARKRAADNQEYVLSQHSHGVSF